MINQIYNSKILEFAGNISHIGPLENANATAVTHARLCGSKIQVWLQMRDHIVSDFGQQTRACVLGQATTSIVARHIIGASADELRQLRQEMSAMLCENGAPPRGKFADLKYLQPIKDYRARHGSTMLVFDAIVSALDLIDDEQAGKESKQGEDAQEGKEGGQKLPKRR